MSAHVPRINPDFGLMDTRKISLVLLFALSLILVGITIYRVEGVIVRHSDQRFRSLLASLEILAAAAVANALVLGSFVRDRGTKKQRFRFGSTGGHSSLDRSTTVPRRALTTRNWGSDADLVGDIGMRLDPELVEKQAGVPRPAPIALPNGSTARGVSGDAVDRNWAFPKRASVDTEGTDLKSAVPIRDLQPSPTSELPTTPRGMSFFDVGGLLGATDSPRRQSTAVLQPYQNMPPSPNLLPPPSRGSATDARRGSHALLQDIGGLLSLAASPMNSHRPTPSTRTADLIEALQTTPPSSATAPSVPRPQRQRVPRALQDVGGLLS